jgi:hypothetical protein
MWDKDDHSSRWIQGLCTIPLLAWIVIGSHLLLSDPYPHAYGSRGQGAIAGSVVGAALLAARCLWYALTGTNNINRDDY